MNVGLTLGYLILSLVLLASWGHTAHRAPLAWMVGLTGNGPCCDDYDCTEATVAILAQGPQHTVVLVGSTELTLPSSWVHPTQDGRGYWCFRGWQGYYTDVDGINRAIPPATPTRQNTRCVFYHGSG